MKRDSIGEAFLRWRKEQQDALDAGPATESIFTGAVGEVLFRAFQAGYVFGVEETAKTAMLRRNVLRGQKRAREAGIKAARELR